jgi:hypothetical protein
MATDDYAALATQAHRRRREQGSSCGCSSFAADCFAQKNDFEFGELAGLGIDLD